MVNSRVNGQSGTSLVEIVMALGILSVVLIALGGLMFQVARHTRQSAVSSYRSAALSGEAGWAQVLPWGRVDGDSVGGCVADTTGPMTYSRCVFVAQLSPQDRRVTVVITPTGTLSGRPDSVIVQRTKPRLPSPLAVN